MVTSKKTDKARKSSKVRMTLDEAIKQARVLKRGEKTVKELNALKEDGIDYSDIPQLTEAFWQNVRLLRPSHKTIMTLRLDDDVIHWFKDLGKGYQSEINAVLKAYVETRKVMDRRTGRE